MQYLTNRNTTQTPDTITTTCSIHSKHDYNHAPQSGVLGHIFGDGLVSGSQLDVLHLTVPGVPDNLRNPTPHLPAHLGSSCTHLPDMIYALVSPNQTVLNTLWRKRYRRIPTPSKTLQRSTTTMHGFGALVVLAESKQTQYNPYRTSNAICVAQNSTKMTYHNLQFWGIASQMAWFSGHNSTCCTSLTLVCPTPMQLRIYWRIPSAPVAPKCLTWYTQ